MDRIDVGQILESKAPRLNRYIPRCVINWLRGLIHEDFLNNAIENFGDKPPLEFIRGAFDLLNIQRSVEGFENSEWIAFEGMTTRNGTEVAVLKLASGNHSFKLNDTKWSAKTK